MPATAATTPTRPAAAIPPSVGAAALTVLTKIEEEVGEEVESPFVAVEVVEIVLVGTDTVEFPLKELTVLPLGRLLDDEVG
jgi:hypothetical protein